MKRSFLVGLALSALLPSIAWSDGGLSAPTTGYIACPEGLYHCGEMSQGPHSGKVPVYCHQSDMNQQASDIATWDARVGQIIADQKAVANTLSGMAVAYKDYAPKKAYFTDVAKNTNEGLISSFISPIKSDLDKAGSCIWDPQWIRSSDGCRLIDLTCYDRYNITFRIMELPHLFDELMQDWQANYSMLIAGLPTGCLQSWNGICYKWCNSSTPPCQQHMIATMGTLYQAETAIKNEAHP